MANGAPTLNEILRTCNLAFRLKSGLTLIRYQASELLLQLNFYSAFEPIVVQDANSFCRSQTPTA